MTALARRLTLALAGAAVALTVGFAGVTFVRLVGMVVRVRRVPAWRSATMGAAGADSYTAFGYANPTRRVLASVLHTQAEVVEIEAVGDGDQAWGAPRVLAYDANVPVLR